MAKKKRLPQELPITLYGGEKHLAKRRRAILEKHKILQKRTLSDLVWCSLEDGPSRELMAELRAARVA